MKNILLILLMVIFSAGIFSCNDMASAETGKKTMDTNKLYEKYKHMVTEGDGCVPCIDCAALALAMTYNTPNEVALSKQKLVNYYKENGEIPCPELLPGLKEEIALMANSK